MKPACQFNRGHGIHDEPDAPRQPVESNYEHSNESEDEYDDIEFDPDESDENVGVEDEAWFHSYDEEQLVFEALFIVGRRTRFGGIIVSMEDLYNRVSIRLFQAPR